MVEGRWGAWSGKLGREGKACSSSLPILLLYLFAFFPMPLCLLPFFFPAFFLGYMRYVVFEMSEHDEKELYKMRCYVVC